MSIASQPVPAPSHPFADLDRLGDEIAELSAPLDAATARLLTLIREFDARGGWNSGFSSCAAWLGWRVGLDLGPPVSGCASPARPDGRPLPEVPPTAPVPADPIHTLHAQHAALGLRLHARTACPGWLGERLDLGWALDVLHPLGTRHLEEEPRAPLPLVDPVLQQAGRRHVSHFIA